MTERRPLTRAPYKKADRVLWSSATPSQRARSCACWQPWTCLSMSPVSVTFSTLYLLLLHYLGFPGVLSLSYVKALKEINIPLISVVNCCKMVDCWRSWMKEVVLRYKVGLWIYISGALWRKPERQWHKYSHTLQLFPVIWNVLQKHIRLINSAPSNTELNTAKNNRDGSFYPLWQYNKWLTT